MDLELKADNGSCVEQEGNTSEDVGSEENKDVRDSAGEEGKVDSSGMWLNSSVLSCMILLNGPVWYLDNIILYFNNIINLNCYCLYL